jgi:hypothetical protein
VYKQLGKRPVTLEFVGSGDSMLYSDPKEASEVEACWNSCLELTIARGGSLNVVKHPEAVVDLTSVVRCD